MPVLLLAACQQTDFNLEPEGGQSHTLVQRPCGTGHGTAEQPFTTEDILNGNAPQDTASCWVIGYVVGATYQSIQNAEFKQHTTYTTNILLASDSTCTDIEKCIPIELKGAKMQKAFALAHNPNGFRQCAMLQGTIGTYFRKTGLRHTTAGHWLHGFNLSHITPQEWQTDSIP